MTEEFQFWLDHNPLDGVSAEEAARAAWDFQEGRLAFLQQRYDQTKKWASDCICRCPIQEL